MAWKEIRKLLASAPRISLFLARNVKPAVRKGKAEIFWAKLIAADLYSEVVPAGMSP